MGTCICDQFVYCFGGVSKINTVFHNVIERLDISIIVHDEVDESIEEYYLKNMKWEIITPQFSSDLLYGYNFGCCQMSTDEIFIFGGNIKNPLKSGGHSTTSKSVYILNTKQHSLKFYNGDQDEELKTMDYDEDQY